LSEILARFQAIEADGVWHLLRVFERANTRDKVNVFAHIVEEASHADQFSYLAKKNSPLPVYFPQTERVDLYPPSVPLWKTLAFVHVGEVDATNQFRAIIKNLPEGELQKSFSGIVLDESGHVGLTEQVALSIGASHRQLKLGTLSVRTRRFREAWMRSGQRMGNGLTYLLLSTIYWILVPVFTPFARAFIKNAHNPEHTDSVKRLTA
jgi:hypothetical protein